MIIKEKWINTACYLSRMKRGHVDPRSQEYAMIEGHRKRVNCGDSLLFPLLSSAPGHNVTITCISLLAEPSSDNFVSVRELTIKCVSNILKLRRCIRSEYKIP